MKNLSPLGDRVLLRLVEDVSKVGMIYIPDNAKSKEIPRISIVEAVGKGKVIDGKLISTTVKVGERVMHGRFAGDDIKVDGVPHKVVYEDEIYFVFEEEK